MGYLDEGYKSFRVSLPRSPYSTADAIYETKWKLTMSHQWLEALNLLAGSADPYSFSYYYDKKMVHLCFRANRQNITSIVAKVHTVYPEAEVEEIPEFFSDIDSSSHVAVANMTYKRGNIFGVKGYRKITADPIAAFLNTLSELPDNVRAVWQLRARSHYKIQWTYYRLYLEWYYHCLVRFFRPKLWFKRESWKKEVEGFQDKTQHDLMWTEILVAVVIDDPKGEVSPTIAKKQLTGHVNDIVGAWGVLKDTNLNWFVVKKLGFGQEQLKRLELKSPGTYRPSLLTALYEHTTMWHLPRNNPALNIHSVRARRYPPSAELPVVGSHPKLSRVGETLWRGENHPFGFYREDRKRHLLVTGRGGTGKSPMLRTLIQSDLEQGYGCGLLTPSGELFQDVLDLIPASRVKDVVIVDPTDLDYPASLNPFDLTEEKTRMQVTTEMIEIFRRRFPKVWSEEVELAMTYLFLTLFSSKFTTVLSIKRLLTDDEERQRVIESLTERNVKNFWLHDFPQIQETASERVITPIIKIVEDFTASEMLYNSLGQPFNTFEFREIIDTGKIVLIKIPNRELGVANASVLGAMMISRIFQAAMSRADIPFEERRDFNLYIDEFDEFATESYSEILSESRKYALSLTLCSQAVHLLPPAVRATIFSNVVNLISFAVSNEDAAILVKELGPDLLEADLTNLAPGEFYVKMTSHFKAQPVFSGRLRPREEVAKSYAEEALRSAREKYCVPRERAIQIIREWGGKR